ncbi:MAG: hypothetical protein DRJ03_22060, partial [Chloroflexi bacterium]
KSAPVELYERVYRRYPWVRAMVNKVAKVASMLDFEIKPAPEILAQKKEPSQEQRILLEELFRTPNERESFAEFIFWLVARLRLLNEAFVEVTYNAARLPVDLYPLPGKVKVLVDEHGVLKSPAYRQTLGGKTAEFEADEVIHFRLPDALGRVQSLPDIETLEVTILTDLNKQLWMKELVTSGAYGRDIIAWVLRGNLAPDEVERNKEAIKNQYRGSAGAAAEPVVVEGDVDFKNQGRHIKEDEYWEGRLGHIREIGAVLDVPLAKLNQFEALGKAGLEEVDRAFIRETVFPILRVIENKFNHAIVRLWGITDWRFAFKRFEPREWRDIARIIQVMQKAGYITVNEARRFVGLEPVAGGDELILIHDRYGIIKMTDLKAEAERIRGVVGLSVEGETALRKRPPEPQEQILRSVTARAYAAFRTIVERAQSRFLKWLKRNWRVREKDAATLQLSPAEEEWLQSALQQIRFDGLGTLLARTTKEALERGYRYMRRLLGLGIEFDRVPEEVLREIEERELELAESTVVDFKHGEPESGRLNIERILRQGIEERWTIDEVSAKVEEVFNDMASWKAARIVRTEIPKAFEKGKIDVAKSAGVTRARISLGSTPCEACVDFFNSIPEEGLPIAEVEEFFANHHPNVDCTFVPIYRGETVYPV